MTKLPKMEMVLEEGKFAFGLRAMGFSLRAISERVEEKFGTKYEEKVIEKRLVSISRELPACGPNDENLLEAIEAVNKIINTTWLQVEELLELPLKTRIYRLDRMLRTTLVALDQRAKLHRLLDYDLQQLIKDQRQKLDESMEKVNIQQEKILRVLMKKNPGIWREFRREYEIIKTNGSSGDSLN